jgi:hypothetical protein
MSYYAIGIGGTGAKCIEALVFLTAAGLLPDNSELYVLFIDPDASNGNLERAGNLVKCYTNCRKDIVVDTQFLKTKIEIADPDVWSPLSAVNQLDKFFSYHTLGAAHEEVAHLFDVLYSPEEKETSLEKGFRGRPSIGAAVMATSVDLEGSEPWLTFWENVAQDIGEGKEARIMLFGSIFGGTGASGFPTVARILRNKFEKRHKENKIRIGGALMLPYFSFDTVQTDEMKADSQDFLLNTQSALEYYYQQNQLRDEQLGTFDLTYLVGCPNQRQMQTSSLGGTTQENDSHFAELYAALSAVEFFTAKEFDARRSYKLVARNNMDELQWTDLPFDNQIVLREKLLHLVRFSFAYLSTYYPMLEEIAASGKGYRAPWYVDFFDRMDVNVRDRLEKELKDLNEFCRSFLLWFANIEHSVTGIVTGKEHVIKFSPFAYLRKNEKGKEKLVLREENSVNRFDLPGFEDLLLPGMNKKRAGLPHVWQGMCEGVPKLNEQNAWAFINELYKQTGNPVNKA